MKTVGIIGAGQLARMLTLAAYPFGIKTKCLSFADENPASDVTEVIICQENDQDAIKNFVNQVEIVTIETENIPIAFAKKIAAQKPLYPSVETLAIAQDRLQEKQLFRNFNINTAQFYAIDSLEALKAAAKQLGFPCILKTRFYGYDGKGQAVIKCEQDLLQAWEQLGTHALILESFVPFEMEVSLICARNLNGQIEFYPLTHNEHQNGILRVSQAPYKHPLAELAQTQVSHLLKHLNYVGVFTVEFFIANNTLIANECAPRVHNSGHWTIEGAHTSQFEQHIRAVCNLPLGSTKPRGFSLMHNCIGHMPEIEKVLTIPGAHYHTYEKTPRINRKVGHITLCSENKSDLLEWAKKL
ncbi:MAG: 5-(carboxyamino)imidazole ribonucleotide synthase [Legionellales bacterium]|jgi:5-(carboxyamino)imidazole ribonucleotide synthase